MGEGGKQGKPRKEEGDWEGMSRWKRLDIDILILVG